MNTSSGYHAAVGRKKKSNAAKPPKSKSGGTQQLVPDLALSAYGKRRKMKLRGGI